MLLINECWTCECQKCATGCFLLDPLCGEGKAEKGGFLKVTFLISWLRTAGKGYECSLTDQVGMKSRVIVLWHVEISSVRHGLR